MGKFEEVYTENYRAIYRVAQKMLGNGCDATDIIQEVFMDFFEKSKNGNVIKYPRSWLYRVALNKCVDRIRKNKNHADIEIVGDKSDDSDFSEKHELKTIVDIALSRIKPKEKMLAVLYSEGLSYKEIAGATGIKASSIGKMLSRTLKKMEHELKKLGYEVY